MRNPPKNPPSSSQRPPQKSTQAPKPLPYKPQPYRPPESAPAPSPLTAPTTSSTPPRFIPPRSRRIPLYLAGGVALIGGAYTVFIHRSLSGPPSTLNVPADVTDRYDAKAGFFDAEVNWTEWAWGIKKLRRKLTQKAYGDVLEVSAGTGRNVDFFPLERCKSVTLLDLSAPMLEIARKKWMESHPAYKNVRFLQQSALEPVSSPGGDKFDTVIQTFGLCSTPEPEKLLRNLEKVVKEDGQILLLEHGRSNYKWLDRLLDNSAPSHADKWGCWWNKDIGAIVGASELQVVRIKRRHLGTMWWIELKPRKRRGHSEEAIEDTSDEKQLKLEQRGIAEQHVAKKSEKK
ncbi:hypothetical protein H2201_001818 [Coniosporium apollinis]|uniref:Methyltransferase domain-containing protein n=1 Tax=Coniosporium apollinis TaxID=61459 RepID=A0ABQ9P078_9PEZI|nr:hypothetical protein H2201_001818 [Coniosporium apollinis]